MSDGKDKIPLYSTRYSIVIVNKESEGERIFGTFTTNGDTYVELVNHVAMMINTISESFSDKEIMFKWEDGDCDLSTFDIVG